MTDWGQDTGLSKGTLYSGIGHAGLILWVVVGEFLFPHSEPEAIEVMTVSTISSAEFDAMQSTSPAPPAPDAPEQTDVAEPEAAPPTPAAEPEVQPDPAPAPQPEPEPLTETLPEPEPAPEPEPDPLPPVADPAPDDVVLAPEEQPIPTMETSLRPKPKPAPVVAPDPVSTPDETVTAETPTEATSEEPAETPPEVIEEPQPETAPEDTGDVIETEATEAQEDPLGMASSPRPKSRPSRPAPAPEPATETAETPASEAPDDTAAEDAIAAALAEAEAEAAAEAERAAAAAAAASDTLAPAGPPLSAGEIGDVRSAIGGKWSLGAVSTDTMRTTIVVRVSFDPTGKPTDIKLLESDGPSQAATDTAFSAARSAIIRAAREGGIPFPPDKYETWKVVDFVFDPNGMRFR